MKRKNNKIVIRTDLGMSLAFLVVSLMFWAISTMEGNSLLYQNCLVITAGTFLIMAGLAYIPKITLKINDAFLTVDNGTYAKDFIICNLRYVTVYGILVLTDEKSTIYLSKSWKLIRELKKLGAIKEELK